MTVTIDISSGFKPIVVFNYKFVGISFRNAERSAGRTSGNLLFTTTGTKEIGRRNDEGVLVTCGIGNNFSRRCSNISISSDFYTGFICSKGTRLDRVSNAVMEITIRRDAFRTGRSKSNFFMCGRKRGFIDDVSIDLFAVGKITVKKDTGSEFAVAKAVTDIATTRSAIRNNETVFFMGSSFHVDTMSRMRDYLSDTLASDPLWFLQ